MDDLKGAHQKSIRHRAEILASNQCGGIVKENRVEGGQGGFVASCHDETQPLPLL